MPDNFNLDDLLSIPEYEEKAKEFLQETPWRLNNLYHITMNDYSIRISMSGSDDSMMQNGRDRFIKEIEHLADKDGLVAVSKVERAKTGNDEVDNSLFWDVNEMKRERAEEDIYYAHNYKVFGSINFETEGTLEIALYDWNKAVQAFEEICRDGLNAGGKLDNKLRAAVYKRHDGTVCIQLFFSFLFNDAIKAPAFNPELAKKHFDLLLEQIFKHYGGYKEYEVLILEDIE